MSNFEIALEIFNRVLQNMHFTGFSFCDYDIFELWRQAWVRRPPLWPLSTRKTAYSNIWQCPSGTTSGRYPIGLKFGRSLSIIAEPLAKFQSNTGSLTPDFAVSRICEVLCIFFISHFQLRQLSNIRRTLVANKIADHSDVVGASPVVFHFQVVCLSIFCGMPYCHWGSPWWRHQMDTCSESLALCEGNPSITGGFPSQSPLAVILTLLITLPSFTRKLSFDIAVSFW